MAAASMAAPFARRLPRRRRAPPRLPCRHAPLCLSSSRHGLCRRLKLTSSSSTAETSPRATGAGSRAAASSSSSSSSPPLSLLHRRRCSWRWRGGADLGPPRPPPCRSAIDPSLLLFLFLYAPLEASWVGSAMDATGPGSSARICHGRCRTRLPGLPSLCASHGGMEPVGHGRWRHGSTSCCPLGTTSPPLCAVHGGLLLLPCSKPGGASFFKPAGRLLLPSSRSGTAREPPVVVHSGGEKGDWASAV
ncbi:hypothetical protein U9M48_036612 [Paspalum notatum var. saurae]|uniref:Uncharacterized protein n=1 Tax=Paspalum notatum var. saurae TaxID=547442 RepID=A0AAQ3UHY8_PASNO